jgi:surface protein
MPAFTFSVKTDYPGVTSTTQFLLPFISGGSYNCTVNWGDASSDVITVWNAAATTHTYASAGTYTITISGTLVGWQFNNGGDRQKFLNVSQWGDLIIYGNAAFYGCSNLTSTATDALAIATGATDLSNMFKGCAALTTLDTSAWDLSSLSNGSRMFEGCAALTSLDTSGWDLSSLSDGGYMFYGCAALTSLDASGWDLSSLSNGVVMFQGCTLARYTYDQMLINLSGRSLRSNVLFNGGNSKYTVSSAAATARAYLISNFQWSISDGGSAAVLPGLPPPFGVTGGGGASTIFPPFRRL